MILLASAMAAFQVALASPDRSIGITVASDGARYSVTRNREAILVNAPLGLELADGDGFSGLGMPDRASGPSIAACR